jgi:hypothetical protein
MSLALLADSPCADCGALLDQGQRYCVHCGKRRPDVEDPAFTWLASARTPVVEAGAARPARVAPGRNPLALPALTLLLLPVAVALGTLVGPHGNHNQQQLLDALRNQKPAVVKVNGGAAGAGVASAGTAKAAKRSKAKAGTADKTGAKVVAKTKYGVAHQISGYKPTAAKIQSDKKLVQHLNRAVGKNYLQAQKNLPDTIVVTPGSGSTTSPGAQGRGD